MKWGYSFYIKKWVFTGEGLCLTGLARFFFYFQNIIQVLLSTGTVP